MHFAELCTLLSIFCCSYRFLVVVVVLINSEGYSGQKHLPNTITIFILCVLRPADISSIYEALMAIFRCILIDFVKHKMCVFCT